MPQGEAAVGLGAARSVGALSFWCHTGHFVPVELFPETRACPAMEWQGWGAEGGREGADEAGSPLLEQVGGGRGVGGECKAWSGLPNRRVVGACSSCDLFWSQEWVGVEGISKPIPAGEC